MARSKQTELERQALLLDNQLCFPLYAAANLVQRMFRPLLAPLGLTYVQYLVMLVLWERGEAYVGELKKCLHLDIGTMTPLLKRMEKAGLITRTRDPDDERRVIVAPTPHGHALRAKAAQAPLMLLGELETPIEEIIALRDMTSALVTRMARKFERMEGQAHG
jgi:MarR family transcriptional regulator, organic hydroperoxide resistance regulator